MKIAILSDIHGNMPALEVAAAHVAAWQPDSVIVNGDTVNRGPASLAAWQFVQAQTNWRLLKGNHEEYVIGHGNGAGEQNGRLFEIHRLSYWSYLQHGGDVAAMADLADGLSIFAPDGSELRLRHASMQNNRDGIWEKAPLNIVRKKIGTPPAVFATAHIHRPFVRQVDETLLVNSGSVGTLADGDPRASYAQVVWQNGRWDAKIIRLAYDRVCTHQAYVASGFLAEAGPIGWLIFHEWQEACSMVPGWMRRYFDLVMTGEVALETAVVTYLTELGLPKPCKRN
ncbi:MAG: metallophosphoesterase family protein [Chloroflexi bacterium]|nr:metallophosphoesterase family protein [Chloroflexota bacterium]